DADTSSSNALQPGTHTIAVLGNQVGATFGLAQDPQSQAIFAAAFTKRHSGYGPGGTGAIYKIDPATISSTLLVDLNAVFGPGTVGENFRAGYASQDAYLDDGGNTGWD